MGKTLAYYLRLPYPVTLKPAPDGLWVANIPLLHGCVVSGPDREDVLRQIDDEKQHWLAEALAHGKRIPEPVRFGDDIRRTGDCH